MRVGVGFGVVLILCLFEPVYGVEISCKNYELEILEKFNVTEFHGGQLIYDGEQEKVIAKGDLVGEDVFAGAAGIVCDEEKTNRGACWGEPFRTTIYENGVIVERGSTSDLFVLYADFPRTPSGVSRGMTRKEVAEILGTPTEERENFLQYQLAQSDEFLGGGLVSILLKVSLR